MNTPTITIELGPDGSVKIEGHCFKGSECAKATEAFEKALGSVKATKRKPEFIQQAQTVKAKQ